MLEAAKECRYHALWSVLLLGGLRPGEAHGLKWDAVDLDTGEVVVRQAIYRAGVEREAHPEGWALADPKTDTSYRAVTLPLQAIRALRTWKAEQARERLQAGDEYTDYGFVFTTPFGSPLDSSNLYEQQFRPLMARAGLGEWGVIRKGKKEYPRFYPSHRVYDFRHTHATLLLANGEDIKVVSERLGHKNVQITYDYYVHVLPKTKAETAARLEAMFGA